MTIIEELQKAIPEAAAAGTELLRKSQMVLDFSASAHDHHKAYTRMNDRGTMSNVKAKGMKHAETKETPAFKIREVEVSRSNVTVAEFLAAAKAACAKKGMDFNIERDFFENPSHPSNDSYFVRDGIKYARYGDGEPTREYDGSDAAAKAETSRMKPYDYQTYILNHDGSAYNETCEFTFDSDKRGHGYYYQINKDVVESNTHEMTQGEYADAMIAANPEMTGSEMDALGQKHYDAVMQAANARKTIPAKVQADIGCFQDPRTKTMFEPDAVQACRSTIKEMTRKADQYGGPFSEHEGSALANGGDTAKESGIKNTDPNWNMAVDVYTAGTYRGIIDEQGQGVASEGYHHPTRGAGSDDEDFDTIQNVEARMDRRFEKLDKPVEIDGREYTHKEETADGTMYLALKIYEE